MLLVHASLTEPLVRLATNLIADLGLAGVALLTLTSGVIGVPGTEPTMLFAGFDVFRGNLTLVGVIVAGVVGDVAGASIAYAIGYFGSQELLEHQGSKLHIRPGSIERAHRWFDRYGIPVMVVTRLAPFIRAAFPYAAGVARMSFWRCIGAATLGSIIWIGGLGLLGREVGSQWQTWRHHLEYVDYVGVVVLLAAIAYLIVRRLRSSRTTDPGVDGRGGVGGSASPETAVDVVPD